MARTNASIPQGDIYPNGLELDAPDRVVQTTTHVGGSFFKSSPGVPTIRSGRHRLQKNFHGLGIHFTPLRFAEDLGAAGLPLLIDERTPGDVADLPGSERLDDEGKTTADDRVYLAEEGAAETSNESVGARHAHTADLDGIRTETTRFARGLLRNPVDFLSDEYKKTPTKAVLMAAAICSGVYLLAREFEQSYNRRKRRSNSVAAAPAAAVEGTGGAAGAAAGGVGGVAAEIGEGIEEAVEAVAETIEDGTKAVADAVT